MKKLLILFVIFFSFLFISCDEEFSPYGDFKDTFAFTCILKSDTTFQIAILSKGYRPEGFDPYTYTTDPAVLGADIRVWYNDSVYVFRDSTTTRMDTTRYNTPLHFYYSDRFKVANRKPIQLEVLLSNGKRLISSSTTPAEIFFQDGSEVIVPPVSRNIVQLSWQTQAEGTFFAPELTIRYRQNVNGTIEEKEKVVPVRYVEQDGELIPIYPGSVNQNTIVYEMAAVERALQEISEGDPDKQNYTIYQLIGFDLAAYDQPLSRYVSSTSGTVDDLTVTVDVSDYSNIEGGLGIFGSYTKKKYTRLKFQQNFVESYGYNFLIQN